MEKKRKPAIGMCALRHSDGEEISVKCAILRSFGSSVVNDKANVARASCYGVRLIVLAREKWLSSESKYSDSTTRSP